jgi:EAL domain-containing protein (putative c-di-GMP-specific phosphodiesterase class I)
MKAALRRTEFRAAVQPIVCLGDGGLHGFEVLLRWPGGPPPDVFVAAAESAGLAQPVGLWVLDRAAAISSKLRVKGTLCPLSVNVSACQLDDSSFASNVATTLSRHGLTGAALCLELTETFALRNLAQAAETVRKLRQMGCAVGLDDFGTGYSTVRLLTELPVSFIKLDRTFVSKLHTPAGRAVTEHFMSLARALRLGVVAEGVETEQQAHALRESGASFAQGFLFARPAVLAPGEVPLLSQHVCSAGSLLGELGGTPVESGR